MAIIYGSFSVASSANIRPYIDYSYSQNVAGNYSDVTATLYFTKYNNNNNPWNNYHNLTCTGTIDGNNNTVNNEDFDLRPSAPYTQLIRSISQRVYHNADGTKTCNIGYSGNTNVLSVGTYNFSSNEVLATIPREAYITNSVDFTIGNNIPLTLYNAGNLWVKSHLYVNGVLIKSTSHGQTSSTTVTLGGAYDTAIYAQTPNTTAVSMYVVLQTFADSGYITQVGGNRTQYGTAYVNTSTNKPTFTTYTVTSVDKTIYVGDKYDNALTNNSTNTLTGSAQKIISGYSKIRGTITTGNKMVALNSATAVKYRFANGSQAIDGNYSAGSTVDIDIDNATAIATTMTAYDSRALTTAGTPVSLTSIVNYTPPVLSSLTFERDNSIDAPTKLIIAGSYWKNYFGGGTDGVQNTITAHYRYKETTDTWADQTWNTLTLTDTDGELSFNDYKNGDLGASGFDADKSFDIEVRIYDKLNSYIIERTLDRGVPLIDNTQDGIAIGMKYDTARGGNLQVANQPAWTEVTSFSNNWVNYDNSHPHCAYMKDSLGFVHLRGMVKDGATGNTIFSLPAGYRPLKEEEFAVASNGAYGQLYVYPSNGNVVHMVGSNTWFCLNGITFSTT